MEFPCDGANFLLDSGWGLMYYLGSCNVSEIFVPFLKIFYSMQIYEKLTSQRRNKVGVIFGVVWIVKAVLASGQYMALLMTAQ